MADRDEMVAEGLIFACGLEVESPSLPFVAAELVRSNVELSSRLVTADPWLGPQGRFRSAGPRTRCDARLPAFGTQSREHLC